MSFYQGRRFLPQRFRLVLTSVLQTDGLPLADVLGEQQIQDAFDQHKVAFAAEEDGVYTPAVTLWAFLSQVLHKGEQRSCLAAVSRVMVLLVALMRELLGQLDAGDILLTDRYFCSYFLIAMLLEMGVDFVTRRHHARQDDFTQAKRLGKGDYLVRAVDRTR